MDKFRDILIQPQTFYFVTVFVVAGLVIWLLLRWLHRVEQRRRANAQERRGFEALITRTPVDDSRAKSRHRALENIGRRYRQIRHAFLAATLLIMIFLITLPLLGDLPAAYVSFAIGALTVVVGIAAKPVIENLMAGLVISLGQAVRIGDTVKVDEHYGTIESITLTFTIVKIWDWRRYVIPNSQLMQKEFVNYSLNDLYIWAHVEFYVAPDANMDQVRKLAIRAMEESDFFLGNEPPAFWVMGLGKESVRCWVAGWAESPSRAWMLNHEAGTNLGRALQEHGIRTHIHGLDINTSDRAAQRDLT